LDSTEGDVDTGLRQARLSRFGRVLALVTLAYVALNFGASLWLRRPAHHRSSAPLLVSTFAFGALWLLLRGAPRSPRFRDNAITGTPLYLAPETVTAPASVDARTDLYALGAVGYWLLTGTHVFGGRSIMEVCAHHMHSVPEPPSARLGAPVPADLEAVILSCLAKRPEDRPASAQVLRERLRACAAAGLWTNARASG
jgi:serine/threonine-protein kinase